MNPFLLSVPIGLFIRAAVLFTASLICMGVGSAQGPPPSSTETLTLSQVTAAALQVSPSVQAANENMAQARARLGQAQAQRRFQISFNSTASFANGDVYQPPPSSETFGALQNTITIPLPVGGKLSAQELQAQNLYNASEAQVASAKADTAAAVQNAYFDLLKQQALLR